MKSGKVCSLVTPQLQVVASPPGCSSTLEPDHVKILSSVSSSSATGSYQHQYHQPPPSSISSSSINNNYLNINHNHQQSPAAMVLQSYDVSLQDGANVSPYAGDYAPSSLLTSANYYPDLDSSNLYHYHSHHQQLHSHHQG